MEEKREHWSGNIGFLMAAAGSAIGLGNIWKFPYITGMNGGGAFVLIYLGCILLVGIPLMLAELSMGRSTGHGPMGAFRELGKHVSIFPTQLFAILMLIVAIGLLAFKSWGMGSLLLVCAVAMWGINWRFVGLLMGFLIPGVILSYYSVIGGWTLIYTFKSFSGQLNFTDPETASEVFTPIVTASTTMTQLQVVGFALLFILFFMLVVWAGIKKGLERWSKILMPLLFVLLLVLIIRSITLPGAMSGAAFFLKPDFEHLTQLGALEAVGHAFYSLSLAMGIMITYGSYISKKSNLVKLSFTLILLDTMAAMMGGLAIFPAVFAMNFSPTLGPGLVFQIVPAAFNAIPGGLGFMWCGLFFLMLSIAALTSAMSLFEVIVSTIMEEFKISRHLSVTLNGIFVAIIGSLCAVSVASWDNLPAFEEYLSVAFGDMLAGNLFDSLDLFITNWLLPLGGILLSIFVGWVWGTSQGLRELRRGSKGEVDESIWHLLSGVKARPEQPVPAGTITLGILWGLMIRYVAPVAILIAFLKGINAI